MEVKPMLDKRYLEIIDYTGEGYQPCVDYGEWRVAILRFITDLKAENISFLECHKDTDEVFVLLDGHCILLIGEGITTVDNIHAVEMIPKKIYNIKKGAFHNHTLSQDAQVLIIENINTSDLNSERLPLSKKLKEGIVALTRQHWGTIK